jgi:hypothetical protein
VAATGLVVAGVAATGLVVAGVAATGLVVAGVAATGLAVAGVAAWLALAGWEGDIALATRPRAIKLANTSPIHLAIVCLLLEGFTFGMSRM